MPKVIHVMSVIRYDPHAVKLSLSKYGTLEKKPAGSEHVGYNKWTSN